MIKQIVVIAGGLATRLYPITEKIPKSMVEVAGEPFLAHQLRTFKQNGIENVVMCVGHFAEQISNFFGDGSAFGLSIHYSVEEQKKDTGGALKLAYQYLDDIFFTIYGDSYLLQEYKPVADFFYAHNAVGLMCVYYNNNQIEPSRVVLHGNYIQQYRKNPPPQGANYAEYGLNILRKSVVTQIKKEVFPISDYFDLLIAEHQLLAFPVKDRFYEIGSLKGLKETGTLISSLHKNPV